MCGDIKFNLLNKPFGPNVDSNMSDSKSRFMLKRFKVLNGGKMLAKGLAENMELNW
jgi:hypothetical protein